MIRCIECGRADLRPAANRFQGVVRGETYTVKMDGLECPNCHYKTIEGAAMPEFGRLLSDQYRAAHGLLTSEDIRARRRGLGLSQRAFATYVGIGEATVKRVEMGKIQDRHTEEAIKRKTDSVPYDPVAQMWRLQAIVTSTNAGHETIVLDNAVQQTVNLTVTNLPIPQSSRVPAYQANFFNASTRG
jgi:putative zinc finger/helix-turn-helix YgiT family protein